MSDIIEKDVKRIFDFYEEVSFEPHHYTVDKEWMAKHYMFLESIKDLSEEFHRKYSTLYNESHWRRIAFYQTELPEQFYEDFLDKFKSIAKSELIINNKVSIEFIKKHSEAFDTVVWGMVYANV
jgi:hypothetical protein